MISLGDYKLAFPQNPQLYNKKRNSFSKLHLQFKFKYLYPSQNHLNQQKIFINQKQQCYAITQLEGLEQCQVLYDLTKSQHIIFSPYQQIKIIQHKSPAESQQAKFLVLSSLCQQNTLKNICQNMFFNSLTQNVPSEDFCSHFIQRIVLFARIFQEKGLNNLRVITPEHIIIYEKQIYLRFPSVDLIFRDDPMQSQKSPSREIFNQFYKYEQFCSPEILKVFQWMKESQKEDKQVQACGNQTNLSIVNKNDSKFLRGGSNKFNLNLDVRKQFKKSILYSLALNVLYCFGFHIAIEDKYNIIKKPKCLNSYLNELRKQIKTHHGSKFISKLLKLMLQPSQSLRDTISTFAYKMNSTQFILLKGRHTIFNIDQQKQQHIRTQSQVNNTNRLGQNYGKKTIDIRISSLSSVSSSLSLSVNLSWLSVSHQSVLDGSMKNSPSEVHSVLAQERSNKNQRNSKSKRQITNNDLNQIQQKVQIPSPIQFQIQWDEDSCGNSNTSKSSEDKQKKIKNNTLLNKISEKQEIQESDPNNQNNNHKNSLETTEKFENSQKIIKPKNNVHLQSDISKTDVAKRNQSLTLQEPNLSIDEILSDSQNQIKKSFLKSGDKFRAQFHFSQLSNEDQSKNSQQKQNNYQIQLEERDQSTPRKSSFENSNKIPKIINEQFSSDYECDIRQQQSIKQQQNIAAKNHAYNQRLNNKEVRALINLRNSQSQGIFMEDQQQVVSHEATNGCSPYFKQGFDNFNFDQFPEGTQELVLPLKLQGIKQSQGFNNLESQPRNQSFIFEEQPFGDNQHQYQTQQKVIKQKKKKEKEKEKLHQRKKDQYNQRSKVILFTLLMIYGLFGLMDWVLKPNVPKII